jgi:energy-coupling factor transport system ATP-binding protein
LGATVLSLQGVSYRYPGAQHDSLHEISLELPEGEITGVLGATEAGKSTLCLVLGGLAPRVMGGDLRGRLLLDGEDVNDWPMHQLGGKVAVSLGQPTHQLSMVAETVFEEIAFGPANLGLPRDEVVARTERAVEQLALGELLLRDPRRLSGGQQQLVVLAGLLAMRPRCLVLDAPVAHLDARGTELVLAALAAAAAEGTAVLIADQRSDVIARSCDSVLLMVDGRIVRRGPVAEVLADPASWTLGVEEPTEQRLARLLAQAGGA